MSHVPGGLVYKRWLNALRGPGVGGGGGGGGSLRFFDAETLVPVPPETPSGAALTERNLFVSELLASSADGFEGYGAGEPIDGSTVNSNGNTAIISCDPGFSYDDAPSSGRYNTTSGGAVYGWISPFEPLLFTFGSLLSGFGIYFTDMGDFGAIWSATLTDEFDNVTVIPISHTAAVDGALLFWGFLDSTGLRYKSVSFNGTNVADVIGFDDVFLLTLAQIAS